MKNESDFLAAGVDNQEKPGKEELNNPNQEKPDNLRILEQIDQEFEVLEDDAENEIKISPEDELAQLKKRRESITAFNDVTADDRKILEKIDGEMKSLKEKIKKNLFKTIDFMQGVYLEDDTTMPPNEVKEIINNALEDASLIDDIPPAFVFKNEKNLREIVAGMM